MSRCISNKSNDVQVFYLIYVRGLSSYITLYFFPQAIETSKEQLVDQSQRQHMKEQDLSLSNPLLTTPYEYNMPKLHSDFNPLNQCMERDDRLTYATHSILQGTISNGIIPSTKFWSQKEAYAHGEEVTRLLSFIITYNAYMQTL